MSSAPVAVLSEPQPALEPPAAPLPSLGGVSAEATVPGGGGVVVAPTPPLLARAPSGVDKNGTKKKKGCRKIGVYEVEGEAIGEGTFG